MSNESSGRPALPDPQHDRHSAFDEDGPAGPADIASPMVSPLPPMRRNPTLPASAWAPRPRSSVTFPAPSSSWSRPRRSTSPATGGWILAGLFGVPILFGVMSTGGSAGSSATPDGVQYEQGIPYDPQVQPSLELPLTQVPMADVSIHSAEPAPVDPPLGPVKIRIEVVGAETAADISVTSAAGDFATSSGLPMAAEVDVQAWPENFAVTARGSYGKVQIQCRVYADGRLVAIDTGEGTVACLPGSSSK